MFRVAAVTLIYAGVVARSEPVTYNTTNSTTNSTTYSTTTAECQKSTWLGRCARRFCKIEFISDLLPSCATLAPLCVDEEWLRTEQSSRDTDPSKSGDAGASGTGDAGASGTGDADTSNSNGTSNSTVGSNSGESNGGSGQADSVKGNGTSSAKLAPESESGMGIGFILAILGVLFILLLCLCTAFCLYRRRAQPKTMLVM